MRTTLDDEVHDRVVHDPGSDVTGSVRRHALAVAPLLAPAELDGVVARVMARVDGLGPLEPLLTDPAVTEVMVNAGRDVWVERAGRLERVPVAMNTALLDQLLERIVAPLGLRVDRTSPVVDARLPDGSRVHAVVAPLAIDGTCVSVRRFRHAGWPLTAYAPPDVTELLRSAVEQRLNVLVSGPTSSGKTSLLAAIGAVVPPHERIITIEDAAELRLPGDHVVRLEARPATADGAGAVSVRDLLRAALRMRPDRIVVGEVRGPEALDMVQAMNTGHDGSLSTCHANSALDALRRVESMVLEGAPGLPLHALREQVHSSLDLVIHTARRADGARRVIEVSEVVPNPEPGEPRVRRLADADGVRSTPTRTRTAAP
ncbi:MAG TPA: ATPase, T2SS/T4P/T4SS family [Acidimicrobiales bacterium]|nr:ATPase, T2SS/T4P/T4SS family [Acidimicrobiales bacterium]